MEISFRRANTSNLEEIRLIAEIDSRIPPKHDSDFRFDEETVQKEMNFMLKKVSDQDFFEVAIDSRDQIIGFHLIKKDPYIRDLFAGNIYTLWVSPEYRRNGIGSTLKHRGEDWARKSGLDHINTWINTKNQKSISLNEKLGYEITSYKLRKKL
jgi:GNAT superfamily N-acetyltransferase